MLLSFQKIAFSVFIFVFLTSCGTQKQSTLQDLQNTKEITLQKDGLFKVTCKDGTTETASLKQVQNGEICIPPKEGWILSSGTFRQKVLKKTRLSNTCSISLKTYFHENILDKVTLNGSSCKLGVLRFHQCKFSNKKTTCINTDTKSKYETLVATSHQIFELVIEDKDPMVFKQTNSNLIGGIVHNIKESSLNGWERCFVSASSNKLSTGNPYPSKLSKMIAACGGSESNIIVGCMKNDELSSKSANLIVGALIPVPKLLKNLKEGKSRSLEVINGANFYFHKELVFGFYPEEGKSFSSGYDNNKDVSERRIGIYIRRQTKTDIDIYYPKRCAGDIDKTSIASVYYKQI